MPSSPRQCFWIPAEPYDERGWVPSLVTESELGHQPLTGKGAQAQPWFWGRTYAEAQATAKRENAGTFGLSPQQASEIVISSIRMRTRT
jgi:hypothetical protein